MSEQSDPDQSGTNVKPTARVDKDETEQALARILVGSGQVEGDIEFEVSLTGTKFTAQEVRDWLLTGDLYAYYGDTILYDEDGEIVGTITWSDCRNDFVVYEAAVQSADQIGLPEVRRDQLHGQGER